ncbi:hypothetical protein PVT71_11725 [Salipiger sp. H15]|uniref:Uncharacterized protein n=1 Tax=Alloyangia sp. H15 TaxID=3029062 RepID=A0AAU8AE00_9RHOB
MDLSGRASRAEFRIFILGTFLATIVASIINVLIFGPVVETRLVVRTAAQEATQGLKIMNSYGPGPFTALLGLKIILLLARAPWSRRTQPVWAPPGGAQAVRRP